MVSPLRLLPPSKKQIQQIYTIIFQEEFTSDSLYMMLASTLLYFFLPLLAVVFLYTRFYGPHPHLDADPHHHLDPGPGSDWLCKGTKCNDVQLPAAEGASVTLKGDFCFE